MISHKKYLEMTLILAEKGRGFTSPNPMVGCIIVKRGKIIGRGFHKTSGQEHAEIIALNQAGKKARNATMYVNLEPCSHWGQTPPCTESIFEAGIREVVMCTYDPNPLVDGFKELKFRGIKAKIGILQNKAKKLNEAYMKYIKTKRPFTTLKVAMTLDGRIATSTGDSKYITGANSRKFVHQLRNESDAVLVGANTLKRDNPKLDSRMVNGRNPIKIVVDSKLKAKIDGNIMDDPSKVIIATTDKASKKSIENLKKRGVNIIATKPNKGLVDMKSLMKTLGSMGIMNLLIEGGAEVNSSVIKEKLVDKMLIFSAPKIIGKGKGAIGELGITKIDNAINLKEYRTTKIGKDVLVEGYL